MGKGKDRDEEENIKVGFNLVQVHSLEVGSLFFYHGETTLKGISLLITLTWLPHGSKTANLKRMDFSIHSFTSCLMERDSTRR